MSYEQPEGWDVTYSFVAYDGYDRVWYYSHDVEHSGSSFVEDMWVYMGSAVEDPPDWYDVFSSTRVTR